MTDCIKYYMVQHMGRKNGGIIFSLLGTIYLVAL
jgi:hypothetical protein